MCKVTHIPLFHLICIDCLDLMCHYSSLVGSLQWLKFHLKLSFLTAKLIRPGIVAMVKSHMKTSHAKWVGINSGPGDQGLETRGPTGTRFLNTLLHI